MLDAAQTAGHYPIDFDRFNLSGLCAPGHKGLLGPSGIGLMLLRDEFAARLDPLIAGGTGSASDISRTGLNPARPLCPAYTGLKPRSPSLKRQA